MQATMKMASDLALIDMHEQAVEDVVTRGSATAVPITATRAFKLDWWAGHLAVRAEYTAVARLWP